RWPVELCLALELDSDFADPSETGGQRQQTGQKSSAWTAGDRNWELTTTYEAEHDYAHPGEAGLARIRRGLTVRFSNATTPPRREGDRILFSISLAPRER